MQKNFLAYLESKSKEFATKNNVWDIVLYGSFLKGKEDYNDIDLLLIFLDSPLNQRLEISQKFKEILRPTIKNLDVKTINVLELFDAGFLARKGILLDGYSLVDKAGFASKIGFVGRVLFKYNLKNLSHNEKTKFTYSLIGRSDKGLIEKTGAVSVGRGAVLVPAKNSLFFEDFLNKWKINFEKKAVLIEE